MTKKQLTNITNNLITNKETIKTRTKTIISILSTITTNKTISILDSIENKLVETKEEKKEKKEAKKAEKAQTKEIKDIIIQLEETGKYTVEEINEYITHRFDL